MYDRRQNRKNYDKADETEDSRRNPASPENTFCPNLAIPKNLSPKVGHEINKESDQDHNGYRDNQGILERISYLHTLTLATIAIIAFSGRSGTKETWGKEGTQVLPFIVYPIEYTQTLPRLS